MSWQLLLPEPSVAMPMVSPAASMAVMGGMPEPRYMLLTALYATGTPWSTKRLMSPSFMCTQWTARKSGPSSPACASIGTVSRPKRSRDEKLSNGVSLTCMVMRIPVASAVRRTACSPGAVMPQITPMANPMSMRPSPAPPY